MQRHIHLLELTQLVYLGRSLHICPQVTDSMTWLITEKVTKTGTKLYNMQYYVWYTRLE
jgi:hypothetical protein